MFPRRAAVVAASAGAAFYWLAGWSAWPVLGAALALFLALGGARYLWLLSRVLPRDMRYFLLLVKVVTRFKLYFNKKWNLVDIFTEVATKHPDKTAVVFVDDGRKWTYRDLEEYSNRVAHHFRNLGIGKGDMVALYVENCPEHIGLSLGLWKLGAVAAYINYNLKQKSLTHCINIAGPKSLVFSASLAENVVAVVSQLEGDYVTTGAMFHVCGDGREVEGGWRDLGSELEKVSHLPPPPLKEKFFTDLAVYIYTSGTTGLPKACKVNCARFYLVSIVFNALARLTPDDVIYNCLPLYHSAGGMLVLGYMLFHGNTMVLRRRFSASAFFDDCRKYNCTAFQYIGEICRYLLAQPVRDTDASNSVRIAIGNGLRPNIWTTFKNRFGFDRILEFYAATEGIGGCINNSGKVGAVGHLLISLPFPQKTFLVRQIPETGEYVRDDRGFLVKAGVNEPGELIAAIDNSDPIYRYDGYENQKATNKKMMRDVFKKGDLFFKSGDILRMDEEGYLYFCDRTGDTFRWKGENVSTTEVEGTMQKILGLTDVVAYGVLIPGMEGRAGMATVVSDEATLNLPNLYVKLSEALPRYAVPLFIRLSDSMAITGTFKLKKTQVRDEGYDLERVSEPMFFLHPTSRQYVRLTEELVQQINEGKLRL